MSHEVIIRCGYPFFNWNIDIFINSSKVSKGGNQIITASLTNNNLNYLEETVARKHLFSTILVIVITLFVFSGCITPAVVPTPTPEPTDTLMLPTTTPIPPTATPEPPSCKQVERNCLELYFDGESCTNKGPANFNQGPFTLIYFNESEIITNVGVVRVRMDYSWQDYIDYIGEEPSPLHSPYWATEQGAWRRDSELILPGEIFIWDGFLVFGFNGTVCARAEPHGAYLGGGFTVDD